MKRVFSVKKFRETCEEMGEDEKTIDESVDCWAGSCEGLTEEEMKKEGFQTHSEWMVVVEE